MKKITIELNTKSINEARKYLLKLKKQIPKMQQEFLMAVAKWIVKQADGYIDRADLGSLVKSELHKGWDYEKTANGIKIINNANVEKTIGGQKQTVPLAVLVEFGSGVVGQSQAHPNASAEGYEYNVDSASKSIDGSWTFFTNSEELDLPKDALLAHNWYEGKRGKGGEKGKRLLIMTRGAKGVWYAYNAIVDAQMELAKANGGEIGKMWEDIKARYIK
jgi:hypothetical protein